MASLLESYISRLIHLQLQADDWAHKAINDEDVFKRDVAAIMHGASCNHYFIVLDEAVKACNISKALLLKVCGVPATVQEV